MNLNEQMEFDCPILVTDSGEVLTGSFEGIYGPDLYALSDEDGSHLPNTDSDLAEQARSQGWELETGWTGQYGYNGPCMHQSEFVGGGLADYILETPGYWVVTMVEEEDPDDTCSWVVAHREA